MAIKVWNGGSVDYNVAGNWLASGVPATTDDILFDGTSNYDCTTNVDRSGDGTWGTDRTVTVMPEYTGSIGSSGDPLKMNFTGTLAYKGGNKVDSEFWFENANATGVLEAKLAPASFANANACRLTGKFIDADCMRGRIHFETGATITDELRLIADANLGGTAVVEVPNGATVTGTTVHILDGTLISDVAWPLVILCGGGTLQHSLTTAATITELHQGGGEFVSKLGTVTMYYIYGGRFDGATYARWTVTTMHAMRAAIVDLRNGAGITPGTLEKHVMTTGRVLED